MGEAIITRRGGGILKIAGQTEEIVRFGEEINKYDPVCVKFVGVKLPITNLYHGLWVWSKYQFNKYVFSCSSQIIYLKLQTK